MIDSAEVERYKQFALTIAAMGDDRASAKEQNLALMVIELVRIVDHLCAVVLVGTQQVAIEELETSQSAFEDDPTDLRGPGGDL